MGTTILAVVSAVIGFVAGSLSVWKAWRAGYREGLGRGETFTLRIAGRDITIDDDANSEAVKRALINAFSADLKAGRSDVEHAHR